MQPLIFDFRLRQHLSSPGHTFSLDIACQSSAKRIAVIGASGSGKSLTLRLLAGLEPLQEGHVRIRNTCYADTAEGLNLPPQKRRVGLMFQDYALFPHLTVAQNIAFGLHKNLAQPPKAACTQTQFWLDKMQLAHLAHHYPHQISGGQKQRTALARACIVRPEWLLLDEPFSALDADLRRQMREQVLAVQQELDIPLLLVTHDAQDAEVLADEVFDIQNGLIQTVS